jgi:hypothetical protein
MKTGTCYSKLSACFYNYLNSSTKTIHFKQKIC